MQDIATYNLQLKHEKFKKFLTLNNQLHGKKLINHIRIKLEL